LESFLTCDKLHKTAKDLLNIWQVLLCRPAGH